MTTASATVPEGLRQCPICLAARVDPLPTRGAMAAWADEEYTSGAYHDYVAARPMKIRHEKTDRDGQPDCDSAKERHWPLVPAISTLSGDVSSTRGESTRPEYEGNR